MLSYYYYYYCNGCVSVSDEQCVSVFLSVTCYRIIDIQLNGCPLPVLNHEWPSCAVCESDEQYVCVCVFVFLCVSILTECQLHK